MVTTLQALSYILPEARRLGKTIITTNGCFDILHVGHARYLRAAKKLQPNTILIVGVNSDDTVRKLKGDGRPLNTCSDRCEVLAALRYVDYVFEFEEPDPREFIRIIRPDLHTKGGDYIGRLLEQDVVEECGGKVVILPMTEGISTTKIITRASGSSGSH